MIKILASNTSYFFQHLPMRTILDQVDLHMHQLAVSKSNLPNVYRIIKKADVLDCEYRTMQISRKVFNCSGVKVSLKGNNWKYKHHVQNRNHENGPVKTKERSQKRKKSNALKINETEITHSLSLDEIKWCKNTTRALLCTGRKWFTKMYTYKDVISMLINDTILNQRPNEI